MREQAGFNHQNGHYASCNCLRLRNDGASHGFLLKVQVFITQGGVCLMQVELWCLAVVLGWDWRIQSAGINTRPTQTQSSSFSPWFKPVALSKRDVNWHTHHFLTKIATARLIKVSRPSMDTTPNHRHMMRVVFHCPAWTGGFSGNSIFSVMSLI